jgi:arsenate reductase
MPPGLARRATAEAVGTALLVAVVVGSGIAGQRLSPDDTGLQLLESSLATAGGLLALILAFGSVSGAHFNPVVTLADRVFGGMTTVEALVYVTAQTVGAGLGAVVANLMFDLDAVNLSTHVRSSGGLWLGEIVATFGLLLVVLGVVRSGRSASAPAAVAGYIAAAYWFTSSTSFANPAVTIGRTLSDTFAGIAWTSAPAFVAAQVVGGGLAIALATYLFPDLRAVDLVVPHGEAAPVPVPSVQEAAVPAIDDLGTTPGRPGPAVLFLCVHNAGRSQMALGWFEHLAGTRATGWSGGSEPADRVNPAAVAAMAEVGIDISRAQPRRWTDEIVRTADVVVTMGCGDACPYFPGIRYEDWVLDDPAGQGIDGVRPIRDEIEARVRALLASLEVDAT